MHISNRIMQHPILSRSPTIALFNVRCIHNIPIGPIGADTNMPMAKPRIIVYSVKSIKSKNYLILLKYGINHKIV